MGYSHEEFEKAIRGKKVPILVLDQKWHRLFAIHGKPDDVTALEAKINALLQRQGKLNHELKGLKHVKSQLMDSIVQNMEGTSQAAENTTKERKLDEDRRLIDETNARMEEIEDELLELPKMLKETNEALMLRSMEYFYEKLRINKQESEEIDDWIKKIRVELKKNIIRKQNRDINNHEMYAYMHDVLGPEVLDLFDTEYNTDVKKQEE